MTPKCCSASHSNFGFIGSGITVAIGGGRGFED